MDSDELYRDYLEVRLATKSEDGLELFAAAIREARIAEREDLLAKLYADGRASYVAVAALCDDELDRSGALLGRIREKAQAIRAHIATLEKEKPT